MKILPYNLIFFLFLLIFFSSCSETDTLVEGEPEVITSGFEFTEGPYWHPDGYLIFSDIPASIVYRWNPGDSESEIFIEPSGNSNGIAARPDGTLLLAQHVGRLSEVTDDLELIPIAEEYEGKRLNSPNDLAVRSDGIIYFTDPPFGVTDEERELDIGGVYRLDPDATLQLIFDKFTHPNGITFSPDESKLYINDSATGEIIRFDVLENGNVENQQSFANLGPMGDNGAADGMVTDSNGRLYSTGPGGLFIFSEDGTQIDQVSFTPSISNLAWGGDNNDQLFITSHSDVYRLQMNITGW